MSIYRSYFSKNNTIIRESKANTSRSPVTELRYGNGFTKFIFDVDLSNLQEKVSEGEITLNGDTKHILHMTNTIFGDEDLIGEEQLNETVRASSFDLIVFTVEDEWDEGVGYEISPNYSHHSPKNFLYSETPSNWVNATTANEWTIEGIYSTDISGVTSGCTIIATQHFDRGNEDLHVDITDFINDRLSGATTATLGIAFAPVYEIMAAQEYDQTVAFFTKYTTTFFEPHIETIYDDLIKDDRNTFIIGKEQNLYLYVSFQGEMMDLDDNPTVDLLDQSKVAITGYTNLPTTKVSKGVYKVSVTLTGVTSCDSKLYYYDKWDNMSVGTIELEAQTQKFIPISLTSELDFKQSPKSKRYVPFIYGIKNGEKIVRGDVRKVLIDCKEMILATSQPMSDVFYRIYVREGANTQVDVVGWTEINKTPHENMFYLDTSFLIPKEYFIDIKIKYGGEISITNQITSFQIVNEK